MPYINTDIQKYIEEHFESLEIGKEPFPHAIIDNFLPTNLAQSLEAELPPYTDERWMVYRNSIENKKTLNNWNDFPGATYSLFQYFNNPDFFRLIGQAFGYNLCADFGLHGGGWHMHANGGRLNPHLDYDIHPKLGMQRRINLILYISSNWDTAYGGDLGFWKNSSKGKGPAELCKEVEVKFNRAVIFDTSCNSWHGLSRPIDSPEGAYRKSLAVYYLSEPGEHVSQRSRALFAPTEKQKDDKKVLKQIRDRASEKRHASAYRDGEN